MSLRRFREQSRSPRSNSSRVEAASPVLPAAALDRRSRVRNLPLRPEEAEEEARQTAVHRLAPGCVVRTPSMRPLPEADLRERYGMTELTRAPDPTSCLAVAVFELRVRIRVVIARVKAD